MTVSDSDFEAASHRRQEIRASNPVAKRVTYDRRKRVVVISFSNGMALTIPPASVEGLADAPESALSSVEIEGGGLSLHWPKIDVDLFLPALLQGVTGSRAWMAAQLGKKGGTAKSEAKIAASRRNGQSGGRPRKEAPKAAPPQPSRELGRVRLKSAPLATAKKSISRTTVHATKQAATAAAKKSISRSTRDGRLTGKSSARSSSKRTTRTKR
jgi:hypothetical protein